MTRVQLLFGTGRGEEIKIELVSNKLVCIWLVPTDGCIAGSTCRDTLDYGSRCLSS
jgi:hypothetical protein